jgi:hypothetical protein
MITIILFIVVFSASVLSERRIIFNELLAETETGTIPQNHVHILSSSKRNKKGWIEEKIRKIYIKAATTLAFRKMQLGNSKGKSKDYYQLEVSNYRNFIKDLIST